MRSSKAIVLIEVICASALALVTIVAIESTLRSKPVLQWLDLHRPPYIPRSGLVDIRVHVEKQMLHLEALAREPERRVSFVGSSSVVNGIDEYDVKVALKAAPKLQPRNLGLTGMLSSELSPLRSLLVSDGTVAVVYLYNGFSFSDVRNPDAIDARGSAIDDLNHEPIAWWQIRRAARFGERLLSERLWIRRYRNLIISYVERILASDIEPLRSPFDYSVDRPPPPMSERTRVPRPPVSSENWVRRAYIESSERDTTLGYSALSSFCDDLKRNNVRLIISAAPEALFGRTNPYAVGIDFDAIDARIEKISKQCGAYYIGRDKVFEDDDANFVDEVHLSAKGREKYSKAIGAKVDEVLGR
ncbi:hypothetical protein JQ600_30375 [Bradyrhizobium sp. AUGA SZCCT0176]|uniref:hypothetical protein n=1 Tax=Bradyrhizobium sp. AUGA SZCCT0176 TaxID=2807664 RepID=UPI001BA547FE|nr:hypothetical protein [Bradyrhizobium sp. AUGA SZCCT0176]MBR1229197.1 hypothetical protein [Bradyrhizobium sp. AUGA SZCCT0176]